MCSQGTLPLWTQFQARIHPKFCGFAQKTHHLAQTSPSRYLNSARSKSFLKRKLENGIDAEFGGRSRALWVRRHSLMKDWAFVSSVRLSCSGQCGPVSFVWEEGAENLNPQCFALPWGSRGDAGHRADSLACMSLILFLSHTHTPVHNKCVWWYADIEV